MGSDMTKDTVTSKKETQQVEELEQDKYKDLMVKIDEMAKQLKGLANYVKDLRKENLQLVKELAKQEKKKSKESRGQSKEGTKWIRQTNGNHSRIGQILGNPSRREDCKNRCNQENHRLCEG